MGQKRNVALFISLSVLVVGSCFVLFPKDEQVKSNSALKDKVIKPVPENKLVEEDRDRNSIQNRKKACAEVVNSLKIRIEKEVPIWVNYYLEKDSLEYVARVVNESNSQGLEVKRVKFYQLDEDGFPTPYSKYDGQILKKDTDLDEMIKDFKLVSTSETLNFDNYLVEKENGKVKSIENQSSRDTCYFP